MSDLYLVLRTRLDSVPEWVYIDTAVLRAARESKGLSYETMARTVPVAAKTWERYEKAGRVPRPMLPQIAEVLGLEIEQPAVRRVVLPRGEDNGSAVLHELAALRHVVEGFDRKLDVADLEGRLKLIEETLRRLALGVGSSAR